MPESENYFKIPIYMQKQENRNFKENSRPGVNTFCVSKLGILRRVPSIKIPSKNGKSCFTPKEKCVFRVLKLGFLRVQKLTCVLRILEFELLRIPLIQNLISKVLFLAHYKGIYTHHRQS
jgi:hypothetical protein